MQIKTRLVTIEDYDDIYALWCSTEQSKRALNPVDDSREGIERYLKSLRQNYLDQVWSVPRRTLSAEFGSAPEKYNNLFFLPC